MSESLTYASPPFQATDTSPHQFTRSLAATGTQSVIAIGFRNRNGYHCRLIDRAKVREFLRSTFSELVPQQDNELHVEGNWYVQAVPGSARHACQVVELLHEAMSHSTLIPETVTPCFGVAEVEDADCELATSRAIGCTELAGRYRQRPAVWSPTSAMLFQLNGLPRLSD